MTSLKASLKLFLICALLALAASVMRTLVSLYSPTNWLPFLAAVVAAAYFHGWKAALLTALCSIPARWLLQGPGVDGDPISIGGFLLLSGFISLMAAREEIRAREAAAARAAESEMRQAILDSSGAGIALLQNRVLQWTNRRMTELFGYLDAELTGHSTEMLFAHADDFVRLGETAYPVIERGLLYTEELLLKRKDGTVFWCSLAGKLVDAARPERGSIWIVQDVNDRRLQERKLRESEDKYRQAFDINVAVKLIIDPEGGSIVEANNAACKFYGYTREEILQKKITDINVLSPEAVRAEMTRAAAQQRLHFEFKHRLSSGEIRDVEVYSGPILMEGRRYLHSIIHDVTARRQAETSLRESEARFRNLIESVDAVVYTLDLECRYTGVFGHWVSRFAITAEQFIGKTAEDLLGPELGRVHTEANLRALGGESVTYEWSVPGAHGPVYYQTTLSPIRDQNTVTGLVGVGQEITERKKLAETMERHVRLESIGVLAGGIAHDFNNLLTGIYGHIEMALLSTDADERAGLLMRAGATIGRARKLTGQLITFARGGAPETHIADLFPFVKDAVSFALAGSSMKLSITYPDDLWKARYDTAQLSQVLENLVLNARQASPEGSELEISAENLTVEEKAPDLSRGRYVQLSIRDYGSGMTPDVAEHAFDPFFTTRPSGTGLGLPMAFSILKRHGGALRMETWPGLGSVFHLILPAARAGEVDLLPSSLILEPPRQHGPILIMDDQEDVRDVLSTQLKALGYSPYCTQEGSEALSLFKARHPENPFAAVILDLTIPGGMGGLETAREIRRMDQSVPVFIVSGYSRDALPADLAAAGITDVLQKPFKLEELERLLAR